MVLPDRSARRPSSGLRDTYGNGVLPNLVATGFLILCSAVPGMAQCKQNSDDVCVSTQHNTIYRTGAYLKEHQLTAASVRSIRFGKLFEFDVDGDIYGQPLYLPKGSLPGQDRNVVYVATMHNMVYAFDADGEMKKELWKQPLEEAVSLSDNKNDFNEATRQVIQREIGIVSTPVISVANQAIYVVTITKDGSDPDKPNENYHHFIHALSLNTGKPIGERVRIESTGFFSRLQIQRAGLLLSNGEVYVAFASYGDGEDFHGWLFGFDAKSLKPLPTVFDTTPFPAGQGGIWQGGNGPAADDDGNIYVMSGNGDFSTGRELEGPFGNSFIKLKPDLSVAGRFTPSNAGNLNGKDLDLGSGGPLFLPLAKPRLVGAGKEGKLYLLDPNKLGGFGDDKIVQSFIATAEPCKDCTEKPCKDWDPDKFRDKFPDNGCGELSPGINSMGGYYHVHGSPVYWDGQKGTFVYFWGEASKLRRFRFDQKTGKFDVKYDESRVATPTRSMPGAMLSISANGRGASEAIVWATHPTGCQPSTGCPDRKKGACWCDTNLGVFPGMLRAIDASTLTELWNSNQYPEDLLGYCAKFTAPTIANGKVYVATYAEPSDPEKPSENHSPAKLVVYGLKPQDRVRSK
jgi:outer membrane protein assembly factor BamB